MQHVKLKSMKTCSLKAFNTNFMTKIFQQKKLLDKSNASSDIDEAQDRKEKAVYDLEVVSIEDVEKVQLVDNHDCKNKKDICP